MRLIRLSSDPSRRVSFPPFAEIFFFPDLTFGSKIIFGPPPPFTLSYRNITTYLPVN